MTERPYLLFDVFTTERFAGNPLAIFPDGAGIDDATMQRIARELNLSETVFLTRGDDPPAALRIFTPGREVLFAGHPTVGTAIALVDVMCWLPAETTAFVLRERIGDVPIRIERDGGTTTAWLQTPPIAFGDPLDRSTAARGIGVEAGALHDAFEPRVLTAGNPFLFVALRDRASVDRVALDEAALRTIIDFDGVNGVFVFTPVEGGAYSRMLAPMSGIAEDPATGSATGPLGAYLADAGALPLRDGATFASEQGVAMGRRSVIRGRLHVRDGALENVEIGGNAVLVGEGTMRVEP
jgi:trans-2,3-dihydro-3-hydroxyanthranilate isomerase